MPSTVITRRQLSHPLLARRVAAALKTSELADGLLKAHDTEIPEGNKAKATEHLVVWRKLHVEVDVMAHSDELGDQLHGVQVVSFTTLSGGKTLLRINQPEGVQFINKQVDAYEGGLLHAHTTSGATAVYRIDRNYWDGVAQANMLIVDSTPIVGSASEPPSNGSASMYQDDFEVDPNFGDPIFSHRARLSDSQLTNAVRRFMDDSAARGDAAEGNRYADAFIQPVFDLAGQNAHSTIESQNHMPAGWHSDKTVGGYRDTERFNTDMFWVAYVAAIYQGLDGEDYDKNSLRAGTYTHDTNEPDSYKAFTQALGENQFRPVSVVAVEQVFDAQATYSSIPQSDPGYAANHSRALDYYEQLARTAVHEVGHQYWLTHPEPNMNDPEPVEGIMTEGTHRVERENFWFTVRNVIEVLRRTRKPGAGPWTSSQ